MAETTTETPTPTEQEKTKKHGRPLSARKPHAKTEEAHAKTEEAIARWKEERVSANCIQLAQDILKVRITKLAEMTDEKVANIYHWKSVGRCPKSFAEKLDQLTGIDPGKIQRIPINRSLAVIGQKKRVRRDGVIEVTLEPGVDVNTALERTASLLLKAIGINAPNLKLTTEKGD